MTEMTLAEAIAEVKRITKGRPISPSTIITGHLGLFQAEEIATILNATLSDQLIPRTEAELAVALAYQRAGEAVLAACPTGMDAAEAIDIYHEAHAAILALAPAEPLAEVARLRRQIEAVCRAHMVGAERSVALEDRAEAAEAEVARLNTLEAAADVVLRYLTNPDWADQNSATFRNMPWQALYNEMRKDRDDFPALIRTFLEAFTDPEARAALTTQKDATP